MTFKELLEFNGAVNSLYEAHPELKETKFGYAVKRFTDKNIVPVFKIYNEELEILRIDHALVDEKTKALLPSTNFRGYEYGKEEFKALLTAENKLLSEWNPKEFKTEPYISTFVPDLSDEQKEIFKGHLIK